MIHAKTPEEFMEALMKNYLRLKQGQWLWVAKKPLRKAKKP